MGEEEQKKKNGKDEGFFIVLAHSRGEIFYLLLCFLFYLFLVCLGEIGAVSLGAKLVCRKMGL